MAPNSGPVEENVVVERKDPSKTYETYFGFKFEQPLILYNIFFIAAFHLVAVYSIFAVPWIKCWRTVLWGWVIAASAGFGVTGGVHRYFTHKSYKGTRFYQIILLILYASAGHNKLYDWVRDHRVHHKFSETDADPHNSKRGFFFAHCGWLMMKKHPDVIEKGKSVDMSDISNDPLLVWYDRHFSKIKLLFCFIIPTIIPPLFWGETWMNSILSQCFMRYMLLMNMTWLVNSAAHLYGNKPYDKNINPRDNWAVSFFQGGLGEGWHNYHHTFPWDYKASEYGKYNMTTFWIDLFGKLGMTYGHKTASSDLVRRVATKLGDGTHELYGAVVNENGDIEMLTLSKEL